MRGTKWILGAGCAIAALLPGAVSNAQNNVFFGGAGSSAMYAAFKSAATPTLPGGTTVDESLAALTNGATVVDSTVSPAAQDTGNIWIRYNGPSGSRNIAFYVSLDSTVGVRAYLNSAKVTLNFANDGTIIPTDVYNSINNSTVTAGMTDITPTDARVVTARAIAQGYTYPANPVKGVVGGQVNVVPITGSRAVTLTPIGASPIVIFVNTSQTGVGDLGNAAAKDVTRGNLALIFSGNLVRTRGVINDAGLASKPLKVIIREPISGTYTTMEYCGPLSLPFGLSQEDGIWNGGLTTGKNPTNEPTDAGSPGNSVGVAGGRIRVIGTGNLVTYVSNNANSIGYAFWSNGNFPASKTYDSTLLVNKLKYLTVAGVDPIADNYATANGTFPSAPSGATVTLNNVRNGAYPLWSLLRMVTASTPTGLLNTLIGNVSATTDFIAYNQLLVFRSHRPGPGVSGTVSNGNNGIAENGADAGGAVFSVNADKDLFNDFGFELTGIRQ
jgi:ABC-type phosphate transport system substrate-binding protein